MRAFTFCRYFPSKSEGICLLQINTLRFRGKFQYIFQTKFFPLKSAFRCPHLTTVSLMKIEILFGFSYFRFYCTQHIFSYILYSYSSQETHLGCKISCRLQSFSTFPIFYIFIFCLRFELNNISSSLLCLQECA
jgi:hypothetical protein